MLKNSLFQLSLSFSFSAAPLFLIFVSVSAPPFLFLFNSFLFFSVHVCLFFSAQKLFFLAQNVFASAQDTFLVQSKNIIFSPKRFCFSPRYLFSSAQKPLPICGLVPPSFCFFSSCLSFLPLATTYCPFSAQVFSSKPFSATSCLFIWVNLHFLQIWYKI